MAAPCLSTYSRTFSTLSGTPLGAAFGAGVLSSFVGVVPCMYSKDVLNIRECAGVELAAARASSNGKIRFMNRLLGIENRGETSRRARTSSPVTFSGLLVLGFSFRQ